jgi:SAM-dependent methyltransferase
VIGLRRRSPDRELLDGPTLDRAELRINLRELAMMNRLPGGRASSIAAIDQLVDGQREVTILDAGTGGGDMPLAFVRHAANGTSWRVVALDVRPEVLKVAAARLDGREGMTLMLGDVRSLPLPDNAVDIAHASLVLHHLEPDDVAAALRELARVARRGVVINDLRRGIGAFAVTAALVIALARGQYTRHDGILSARRAYRVDELDRIAAAAGLRLLWRTPAWLPRVATAYVRTDG